MKRIVVAILVAAAAALAVMPWHMGKAQPVNNAQVNVIPAAVQTATQINSSDIFNPSYRGVHLVVTISGYTSGTYTATIQGKNNSTGNYYDLLVGPVMNANGQTVLKIHPGITSSVNGASADSLPSTWRVQLNGALSPNMTVSVDAMLIGG